MHLVKVRRVGNSNVISIPREFQQLGFTPGASVLVEESRVGGELRVVPIELLREQLEGTDSGTAAGLEVLKDLFDEPGGPASTA